MNVKVKTKDTKHLKGIKILVVNQSWILPECYILRRQSDKKT